MSISTEFFMEALANEPKKIKKEAGFVCEVLKKELPKAFSTPERLPKRYFEKHAKATFSHHRSDTEFNALRIGLIALYDWCLTKSEGLRPPTIYLRPDADLPYFNDESPSLELCSFAASLTSSAIETCTSDEALLPLLILLLAAHTQTTSVKSLIDFLNAGAPQIMVFKEAQLAAVHFKSGRVILDAVALGALKKIKALHPQKFRLSTLTAELDTAISYYAITFSYGGATPSPREVLRALSYLVQPMVSPRLNRVFTALSPSDFLRTMTGQTQANVEVETVGPVRKRQRGSTREFVTLDKIAALFEHDDNRQLAINNLAKSEDSHLLDTLRKIIFEFKRSAKDEKRNTLQFKLLKKNALELLSSTHCATSKASLVATSVATYIVDLLLYGSNTKSRLAISTILTYLSTIQNFAARAWQEEGLLRSAQSDDISMEILTENVASSLSSLNDSSQQSTVMGFLQYLFQASELKLYDAETLEYLGAGQVDTRAHYISPQDFESACTAFLSPSATAERRQFILYARLAYYAGLRKLEAAQLLTDEVRHDLDALYVSRVFKRKTSRAYRRIPLCFLTKDFSTEIHAHIQHRNSLGLSTLFDRFIISNLSEGFLATLRNVCGKDELVFHSLRHSAINNIFFQLQLCASTPIRRYRTNIYFLKASIFNDAQLNRIQDSLEEVGRLADEHLPVLDIVAQIAGHMSPSVSATSYLHLLDFAFFLKNSTREIDIASSIFLRLLPRNQYRFHLKEQYEKCRSESSQKARGLLFKIFSRGTPDAQNFTLLEAPINISSQDGITFSDFLSELKSYKEATGYQAADALSCHFKEEANTLNIEFLNALANGKGAAAWLRTLEHLEHAAINLKNTNAIHTLAQTIQQHQITNIRSAERHMRALRVFGLSELQISLTVNDEADSRATKWQRAIEKLGFEVRITLDIECKGPSICSKPRNMRWPIWKFLPVILQALQSYQRFLKRKQ